MGEPPFFATRMQEFKKKVSEGGYVVPSNVKVSVEGIHFIS